MSNSLLVAPFEGKGYSLVDGKRFDWVEYDTLAVPGGSWVEHANASTSQPAILFVASETDVTSKKAATLLQAKATGPSHLELIPGSARGTRLLNASPQLESVLVGWLNGSMWLDSAALNQPLLTPSSNPNIETTGTRLEDRH